MEILSHTTLEPSDPVWLKKQEVAGVRGTLPRGRKYFFPLILQPLPHHLQPTLSNQTSQLSPLSSSGHQSHPDSGEPWCGQGHGASSAVPALGLGPQKILNDC